MVMQLTLEQHRFELCWSTYSVFQLIRTPVPNSQGLVAFADVEGSTVKLHNFSTRRAGEEEWERWSSGSNPQTPPVQWSAVLGENIFNTFCNKHKTVY